MKLPRRTLTDFRSVLPYFEGGPTVALRDDPSPGADTFLYFEPETGGAVQIAVARSSFFVRGFNVIRDQKALGTFERRAGLPVGTTHARFSEQQKERRKAGRR